MPKTKYVKKLKILKNTIKNSRISNGNKSKKKSKTFKNKKIKKTKKTNLLRGGTPNPFADHYVIIPIMTMKMTIENTLPLNTHK